MIAVIEVGGKQYTVSEKARLIVDHQNTEVGNTFEVAPLLVADDAGKEVQIGTPFVEGAKVVCQVESHQKGEKVRVFKMKSKKRYVRNRGFRPLQTEITIQSIV